MIWDAMLKNEAYVLKQVPRMHLDFRTDVIRHNTKNHSKGERPQQEHSIQQ